jgi:hypothetical protein
MLSVKRDRAFLLKIMSALLVSALSPASAYAEHENDGVNPGWSQCRSTNPDERIKGCDQVISAVEKETKHNQLAAYINRASAYQAKGDLRLLKSFRG